MPSASQYLNYLALPQVQAFLDVIAWAEGANYNTLYAGGSFSDYSQHPNRAITAGGYTSTAAGRYQFLYSTWHGIQQKLGLPDFSPTNQDIAALDLISQRGALNAVIQGDLVGALQTLGCAWASLPYSGCGQNERSLASVQSYYNNDIAARGGSTDSNQIDNNFLYTQDTTGDLGIDDNTLMILLAIGAVILLS